MRVRGRPVTVPLLVLLSVAAAAASLHETAGMTFFYDEWNFLLERRDGNLGDLLDPHNEHLMLLTALLYKGHLALFGGDTYWPLRVAVTVAHLGVCALVFTYARPRVGDLAALGAATLLLFFGLGWENLLWAVNTSFLVTLAAAIGALLALERSSGRGDLVAMACVALALASSSLGVPVALGVAAELAAGRTLRRRWWVVAAPVAIYLAWRAGYASATPWSRNDILVIPSFGADMAAAAAGAIAGLGIEFGRVLAVVAVVAALVHLATPGAATPRFTGIAVMLLAFWAATAVSRNEVGEPGASRYLHVGAVLGILLATEGLRGRRLPQGHWPLVLAGVLAFAVLGNLKGLNDGGSNLRENSRDTAAALGALEIARDHASDDFRADPQRAPQVQAAGYLALVDDEGSPAWSPDELRRSDERRRLIADATLIGAEAIAAAPAPVACTGGLSVAVGNETPVGPGTLRVRAPDENDVAISLRRFAGGYTQEPLARVPPGQTVVLTLPPDRVPDRWNLRIDGAAGAASVC